MEEQHLRIDETHGGRVRRITIDRPGKYNALGTRTFDELLAAVAATAATPEVSILVVAGTGGKAFCAGADIDDVAAPDGAGFRAFANRTVEMYRALRASPQVVIAAVDGVAYGAGCALAMAADIVIAAPHARFAQPEINVGIVGGAALLPRHLNNRARAVEMVLLGVPADAEEAKGLGLVTRVSPEGRLAETVEETVSALLEKPADVLPLVKEALVRCAGVADNVAAFALQQDIAGLAFDRPGRRARMDAFLARRRR
jgi:enoyl-CoA hydratase